MSEPVQPGRVDHFAKEAFKRLLRHANPQIRFACKLIDEEIDQVFEDELGPGTKAHELGRRFMRAVEGENR